MECAFPLAMIVFASLIHSGWALLRYLLAPATHSPPQRHPAQTCAGCGRRLDLSAGLCRACNLDPFGPRAIQLRQLEAGATLLQELRQGNQLDADTCERVYRCIEGRQLALLHASPPTTQSIDSFAPLTTRELDRILTTCSDLGRLPFAHRRQAVTWFATSFGDELWISVTALSRLAELLEMAGQPHDALTVLRRVVGVPRPVRLGTTARRQAGWHTGLASWRSAWFVAQASGEPLGPGQRATLDPLQDKAVPTRFAPVAAPATVLVEVPPGTPAPPLTPAPPRRSFAEMLAGFMEERNILWGELVGGMLIVGCSIALVISLWRTLEQIPYFPFLVIAALTACLFGAGFYTLSHWKLESTSRGLLVIGTLLVPLNFLVLAGLPARGSEPAGIAGWPGSAGGFLAGCVPRQPRSCLMWASAATGVRSAERCRSPCWVALGVLLVPAWRGPSGRTPCF